MPDDIPKTEVGTDLLGLGKVGAQLIQTGEHFLMRLVGPYLDAKGEILADGVRERRRQNLVFIAAQAAEQVGDQEVKPVPGRVLFPLLDAASNEELPELQRMWASLMAAATVDPDAIPPAFPKILSELSALEARILEFLHEDLTNQYNTIAPKYHTAISVADLVIRYDVTPDPVLLAFANFYRLGLITPEILPVDQSMMQMSLDKVRMTITPFGSALIRACSPIPTVKE